MRINERIEKRGFPTLALSRSGQGFKDISLSQLIPSALLAKVELKYKIKVKRVW